MLRLNSLFAFSLILVYCVQAEMLYEAYFNGNTSHPITTHNDANQALIRSEQSFQSDTGFTLSLQLHKGGLQGHGFSFGLIRSENDQSEYRGQDPFIEGEGIYGLSLNLTSKQGALGQEMYFIKESSRENLLRSKTQSPITLNQPALLTIEIEQGGYWCYRINGSYVTSGVLLEGFDLSKPYHLTVYGEGNVRETIQFLKLKRGYAAGERAKHLRGTWSGGMGLDKIQNLKTMDTVQVRLTDGAVLSASHWGPHRLLERLCRGEIGDDNKPIKLCVPPWGDLSLIEPANDPIREKMLAIRAAGFSVKAYANCENFNGENSNEWEPVAQRWKNFCDTDPQVVAFVNSQPFHTGVWDRKRKVYVDVSKKYPNRKYMFCYAEFVLKDYALRYGDLIDEWIFDSASDINQNGDVFDSGLIEEQRIYQAFAKAVHAGNPDIAIAFNNGRSTVKSPHFPFASPTRFDDFTFGHAFGGNNNHASKEGGQFKRNYLHVQRMTETKGFVFSGGTESWDDQIVGNFHSKLSTRGWKTGNQQAWEENDFLQWNLEAMNAGGIMTWDGSAISKLQRDWTLRPWCYELLKALDDHLAIYESPDTPNWARAYTVLPDAVPGRPYQHELIVGEDLWDPEGDTISSIIKSSNAPEWLNILKDTKREDRWVISGTPTATQEESLEFSLHASDSKGMIGGREVEIRIIQR